MTIQETLAMINRLKQEFAVVRLLSGDCVHQLEPQGGSQLLEIPYRCANVAEVCCVIHRRVEVGHKSCILELINPMPEMSRATDNIGEFLKRIEAFTTAPWRDALTGAYSRRYYDEHPPTAGPDSCIAAIAVDHLTELCAQSGQRAGDYALRSLAGLLMRSVRGGDLLVRFEPNLFLLIFPDIPVYAFKARLETVRHTIAAQWSEEYPKLQITASFGGVRGSGREGLALAIAALEEAARSGNCVVMSAGGD